MSELKVDKITPRLGTTLTLGDTGDTINFGSGVLPNFENLTVTGDLTVDTNSLYVDSANNKVGIGTTSPDSYYSDQLVISCPAEGGVTLVSQGTTQASYLCFADGTTGNEAYRGYVRYSHNTDSLQFASAAAINMTIDSSGNVGIGTASPSYTLQVDHQGSENVTVVAKGTAPGFGLYDTTTSAYNWALYNSNGDLTFYNTLNTNGFNSLSEKMRIDSTGNVLVGTTDDAPANNSANSSADDGFVIKSDGNFQVAKYNSTPAYINRTGSDGILIDFRKSGATVGSIGNYSTNGTKYTGTTTAFWGGGDAGLYADGGSDYILPASPSTDSARDNAIDLGVSGYRFKDLYLSGQTRSTGHFLTGDAFLWNTENNNIRFATNNTERMRINSSGNLSVGTTLSYGILTLGQGTVTSNIGQFNLYDTTSGGGANTGGSIAFMGSDGVSDRGYAVIRGLKQNSTVGNYSGYLSFLTRQNGASVAERMRIHPEGYTELFSSDSYNQLVLTPSGTNAPATINFNTPGTGRARFRVQGNEYMTILSTGNVGIGTSSPTGSGQVLHLNSSSTVTDFHMTNSTTGSASTDGLVIRQSGLNSEILNREAGNTIFYNNGAESMRINSTGDVSIGSTANSGYKLKVDAQGDSRGAGYMLSNVNNQPSFEITNTNTSDYATSVLWVQSNRTTTNGSYNFLRCIQSGVTDKCFIRDSGNLANANSVYGGISDLKLKEQITDAASQWSDIKNIRIRKFKFKHEVAEGDSDSLWKLGVVAQEIETVSPSLVETVKDIDKEGNAVLDDEGNETYTKNVKYSVLYMKSVKALQEAITKIEQLEARIEALENA